MRTTVFQGVACANCALGLPDEFGRIDDRPECPRCRALARLFSISISETLTLHSSLAWKAKHGGRGKPFHEGKVGDEQHRDSGEWRRLARSIDREGDRYRERITRPNGEIIIRDVDEPLREHRGHESARRRPFEGDKTR